MTRNFLFESKQPNRVQISVFCCKLFLFSSRWSDPFSLWHLDPRLYLFIYFIQLVHCAHFGSQLSGCHGNRRSLREDYWPQRKRERKTQTNRKTLTCCQGYSDSLVIGVKKKGLKADRRRWEKGRGLEGIWLTDEATETLSNMKTGWINPKN